MNIIVIIINVINERIISDSKLIFVFSLHVRFQAKESVSGVSQVKSSVQRGIKSKLVEQFPAIDDYIVQILPRKEPLVVVKW